MATIRKHWLVVNGYVSWFKYDEADAFVVTAYLTNKPRAGDDLWPKK